MDNSNLWIEGKRLGAVFRGTSPDILGAIETKDFDNTFRLDFGKVLEIANNKPIKVAKFYGSRPPESDSVWNMAEKVGFEPVIVDRNYSNKEKRVDTQVVVDMLADSMEADPKHDIFILIAGDADYVPVIRKIKEQNFRVQVLFWNHASVELKKETKFISLDGYFNEIRVK
ncbi:MAG: NYN domain-containing protein [Dysgonamonadaceae bacterium]|nr:NYN domain-containing protein [Dysgonamonadaceae bacterium]